MMIWTNYEKSTSNTKMLLISTPKKNINIKESKTVKMIKSKITEEKEEEGSRILII